jgi:hypothetical protein
MATRKVIIQVFPRQSRRADSNGRVYFPNEREEIAKLLGNAMRVVVQCRVYARSTSGAVTFNVYQGTFGEEMPDDSPRGFPLTLTDTIPTLPWNSTNMANLPDDGTFTFEPKMGLVDVAATVTGGDNEWVEFEMYASAEIDA